VSFWGVIKFIIKISKATEKSVRGFCKEGESNILLTLNRLIPTERN
jgi:hypothetical protein